MQNIATQHPEDASDIRSVLEQRRLAWNDTDIASYADLLTEDCDIVSATGRTSRGRKAVIDLYLKQRQDLVYSEALITSTRIDSIRFITNDVALVDAGYQMNHVHWNNESGTVSLDGIMLFVMQRDSSWKIASIRAQPPAFIPTRS